MFADIRETRGSLGARPPFHLCFAKEQVLGKSDVRPLKLDGGFPAGRFYTREAEETMRHFEMDKALVVAAAEGDHTARELYRWSLLTSHAYGWWYEKGILPRDPQLGFHKRTSEMVNLQTRINEEDRKLRGLDNY